MHVTMLTIGYPPENIGGTETYVASLVDGLQRRGHRCSVVYLREIHDATAGDLRIARREHAGTLVRAIEVNRAVHHMERFVLDAALQARVIAAYEECVAELAPDVVHVHPLGLGVESRVIERLAAAGYPVVLTYHTATASCARGDLRYMGRASCDGVIRQHRCTACSMHARGLPAPLALLAARIPAPVSRAIFDRTGSLERGRPGRRLRSALAVPTLIAENAASWRRATRAAREVVALCDWARAVVIANGVPPDRVVSSRHGHRLGPVAPAPATSGPTRFGYLGRLSIAKGITHLLTALATIPADVDFTFEFCSPSFSSRARKGEDGILVGEVERLAAADARIRIRTSATQGAAELAAMLAVWDALVVPSVSIETGPLVIYEAFAVGTPVIGSRHGGIAELVADGRTGVLVPVGDPVALAAVITRAARTPAWLRSMRSNIERPRTMDDVTMEMLAVYDRAARSDQPGGRR